ncbi:MAG: HAD-IA family hydrolase [Myxococcota bacterium]
MPSFRLVVYDLDGTLVDSRGDIADALNFALAQLGLPTHTDEAVERMIGEGATRLVERAIGEARHELDEALAIFRARYGAHLADRTRPYAGVVDMLASSRAQSAVATNKPGGWAREICRGLGLERHLVAILGADDVPRSKPDPAVVDVLRERARVERGETLLVGDSLADIATARAAGVTVCAVSWGYGEESTLRAAAPDYLCHAPAQVSRLIAGGGSG